MEIRNLIPEHSISPQIQTKIIEKNYDYEKVIAFLEAKGKELFGAKFFIRDADHAVIIKLAAYFLEDQATCKRAGISLRKGLILSGPIGCGKTSLMHLMRKIVKYDQLYAVRSCREITFEFIQDGFEVIHKYTRGRLYQMNPLPYCFDDLGVENNIKYFGNECNVMAEILLSRYDLFVSRGVKTYITTNLSASEIEEAYGNRVRSRLREMVNLISFDKNTTDKRN